MSRFSCATLLMLLFASVPAIANAQPPSGPGGFGRPRGGPMENREKSKLVKKHDENGDGWLNQAERNAARESLKTAETMHRPFGLPGGRTREPAKKGPAVSPANVANHPEGELYDPLILRTLFFEFESDDWEQELEDFRYSDVEVPAALTVDGKTYAKVGVRFRGMSSYFTVPAGHKRSLNVSVDLVEDGQRLYGHKTLNLLNSNGDASFMSTVLYSQIARSYIPAPRANLVRVVINGESWGVYVNAEQFNKDFLNANYPSSKGTRWKVPGNPGADGGLRYLGDDLDEYKSRFVMKSNDGEKAWRALIELCRVLNETPLEELESELEPILDIDGALRFLALDVALVNSDGYWTRASDYSLFRDNKGKFHVIPHDMNEAFCSGGGFGPPPRGGEMRLPFGLEEFLPQARDRRPGGGIEDAENREGPRRPQRGGPGGPGGRGRPGHGSVDLDPMVSIDDARTPLRSRLLAIPHLRAKYLEYVHQIAEESLDWDSLGANVAKLRSLIEEDVKADTKKLTTFEAFDVATAPDVDEKSTERALPLRSFAVQRRNFLLRSEDSKQGKPSDESSTE